MALVVRYTAKAAKKKGRCVMEKKTTKELKVIAKELGVKNWWNLKKDELIKGIEEKQQMTPEEQQAEAEQKAREYEAMKMYDKDWRKYTKRYNPVEFIEKFRAGEIVLESEEELEVEEPEVEEVKEPEVEQPKNLETEIKPEPQQLAPKRGQLIEFEGKAQNICAWGKELEISPNTLYGRIYKMGWTVEKAFTTPTKR